MVKSDLSTSHALTDWKVYRNQWQWSSVKSKMRPHHFPGLLVTFEGIDGAGKTTLANELKKHLEKLGIHTLILKSPSKEFQKNPIWKAWHSSLDKRQYIHELGLNLMALGDRLITQQLKVIPALRAGKIVIFDRYILSTLAYWSTPAHRFVTRQLIKPDFGFVCCPHPSLAYQRLLNRKSEPKGLTHLSELVSFSKKYKVLASDFCHKILVTESQTPVQLIRKVVAPSILQKYSKTKSRN